ncbi:Tll0287-like domain-containing protein [Pleomorphovibrio marinus]|uniref:Tll0287-like domain-containing protein n=1 Tax=Pleomorphovibrio marinus TaxID=2164132 RepID=UPI000E0A7638|nr:DUF3365 domain-containing protein [Pleomorphovibrio marinus]
MHKIIAYSCSLLFLSVLACDAGKKVSKEEVDQMKKSTELKKVGEAEITSYALKWGEELSQEAQNALMGALQEAISEKGIPGAVEFCNVEALPLTKRVGDEYGVTIKRISTRNRNPENVPGETEEPLLDAYAYNAEEGIENVPNIQKTDNGETLIFTKAIVIPGGLCLNCHGDPDKDISQETYQKIQSLYPEDKATGYKVGELRGMWSIFIPKKEVVKRM